jgi:hypothetical protein
MSLYKKLGDHAPRVACQRFSLFLDSTIPNFDPPPAAAGLLDPTVSAPLLGDDLQPLLAAAKLYIKSKISIAVLTT